MKIVVTGTRGIPNIQGGIETHCEELYPRLSRLGFDVKLVRRSWYISPTDKLKEFNGVKLTTLYAPHIEGLEGFMHTFLAIIWAKSQNADIIHLHAIGPAIMSPFARFLGLKVVYTHHGFDYDRAKWGRFAKFVLRIGERLGTFAANEVIVISSIIQESLIKKYNRKNTHLIFNGVNAPVYVKQSEYIESLGLQPRMYIMALGRFVEEKGFDYLIRAFSKIKNQNHRLVIAGDSDHETEYSKQLKEFAKANNVVLPGFVKGKKLQELFSHARLFVMPSFHEGLPISLLEAMSYDLPVLVSDIPANKQISLPENRFFKTGNEDSLIRGLEQQLNHNFELVKYDLTPYNWDNIALQTKTVYEQVMK
jgi:glycosyltransferase involved in cell wall biosynthesis